MSELIASNDDLNSSFYCPITADLMVDPVIDLDGNSYERTAITEWLQRTGLSPITRSAMQISDLIPNRALADAIEAERGNLAARRPDAVPMDPSMDLRAALPPELELTVSGIPYTDINPDDNSGDYVFLANVHSPATAERTPTDIVVCIDKSGSMGTDASTAGVESSGLNMLDIVKHAVRTIAEVLQPTDRIAVVAWSSAATVVTELTPMNSRGKQNTVNKVKELQEDGMTNIWEGMKTGLDLLSNRGDEIVGGLPSKTRNAAVFLLTDGVPNVEPPRGYIESLRRYKEKNDGRYPGIINTFGFGYNLKSDLLADYASEGGGVYAFIPDSGFVGTVFVNALANCLTTVTESAVVSMSCDSDGCSVRSLSEGDVAGEFGDGVTWKAKTIQNGQAYGKIIRVSGGELVNLTDVSATLKYNRHEEPLTITARGTCPIDELSEAQKQEVALETFRYLSISAMTFAIEKYSSNPNSSKEKVQEVIDLIKGWLARHEEVPADNLSGELGETPSPARKRLEDLLTDLEGQISEAISKEEFYNKWGAHFIRSIRCAHEQKQCNNFKDPGVQHYGNKIFKSVRDNADDAFSNLPPPEPSTRHFDYGYGGGSSRFAGAVSPAVSMSNWNRPDNVCFHGRSVVTMAHGREKAVADIRRGDVLDNGGIVRCVIQTIIPSGQTDLVLLPGGLLVTPWHPVKEGSEWVFPIEIGMLQLATPCEAVYSFLVENRSNSKRRVDEGDDAATSWPFTDSVTVGGVTCAALAHGILNTPKVSHQFFGTIAVVEALSQCTGWEDGFVTFRSNTEGGPGFLVREEGSGIVVGITA